MFAIYFKDNNNYYCSLMISLKINILSIFYLYPNRGVIILYQIKKKRKEIDIVTGRRKQMEITQTSLIWREDITAAWHVADLE